MKNCCILSILGILIFQTFGFTAQPDILFPSLQSQTILKNVLVERIISADTIVLEDGKKIKLIGLKAPDAPRRPKVEYDKNGLPIENVVLPENTFEEKAYAFAHKLLVGKKVRLEFDETRTDDHFATIAYVFLVDNNILVNAEILRWGYADLQIQPPNFKYQDQLRDAYKEARREKRGLQNQ
ncbi:MAG: thermonuclease family protein [Candidatus Omnitrophica bacterium]|nr:thermonuclease family protein [Candidatus Omnitrophota bacterium]